MKISSGNAEEDRRRRILCDKLGPHFEIFEEVWVRHPLFRRRRLRVDILAIPREVRYSSIAIGFEVKGYPDWDIPSLGTALKQASDYVLATIEPEAAIPDRLHGKRIMAAFVYPGIADLLGVDLRGPPKLAYLAGMIQSASAHRVGTAVDVKDLTLQVGTSEIWVGSKGWRSDANNLLSGQRQIGSQRFSILDELSAFE
jgi:hypothetical protein